METASSVDRLNTSGDMLFKAALALSGSTGVVKEPVELIEVALGQAAEVLRSSERLNNKRAIQARARAGLYLLGLEGCETCMEEIAERMLEHSVCTEETLDDETTT